MRILSGIQPAGEKHIGNYIGAIRQYVSYQDEGDAPYFGFPLSSVVVSFEDEIDVLTATVLRVRLGITLCDVKMLGVT